MIHAEILTGLMGDGLSDDTAYQPRLLGDYGAGLAEMRDTTCRHSVPSPNVYMIFIRCDDTTLAAIEADPKYQVLWSEEEDEAPL
jgi:hypothetical protein